MSVGPPPDLGPAAVAEWRTVVEDMDVRQLTVADRELVRSWCLTVVELRAAEAWVSENGTTFALRDDKGTVRSVGEAPQYRQVRALRADLARSAGQLEEIRRRERWRRAP